MGDSTTFEQLKYQIVVDGDGTKCYYNANGELLREDGPAVIWANGTRLWYVDGELHREDGPAAIHTNGHCAWYVRGELHREDGPAFIWPNGSQFWYWHGVQMSQEEFDAKRKEHV